MTKKIIGHGTWYDKTALEIIKRERWLGRSLDLIHTEMGVSASGIPHVGNLSDAIRSYAVTVALQAQGYRSELVAFADDKDGLRKVPPRMPAKWSKSLSKYLGYPVTSIPDPDKCHENFGEHATSLLLEAFDKCGVNYTFMTATEVYKRGLLNKEIKTILLNAKRVGEIIMKEVGQEKFEEALPYFAICGNCGRIYTTKAHEFLPEENKILYTCEGMEIKKQWFKGCGHKGEADYTRGEGKLAWKVEFAARWKTLDIRFEAYGKDIADSVRVNDRICQEILNYPPPYHAQYELFLAKGGKRYSKSAGTVFTPQVWFRYGSPQSLNLLMLKRFVGTRAISVTDIPLYMNEFDELEDIYFEKKKIENKKELAKLKGLYKYLWWLKPPKKPGIHPPYNLLAYLVKVAPEGSKIEYIMKKLREYGYTQEEVAPSSLEEKIEYAMSWNRDFLEIRETKTKLSKAEKNAIKELAQALQTESDAEQIQGLIFNIARKYEVKPKQFFETLYAILLGAQSGPRLGPYIIAMGRKNVIEALGRTATKGKE
jgi:lysyl-tRNA synthetase class 1